MWKSIAISLLTACAGVAAGWQKIEVESPHMGTLFRIIVYAQDQDEAAARAAIVLAYARIAELDQKLSDYKPNSELNQLCRAAYAKPIPVSADLFEVLQVAQSISNQSNGAFDVTVGPLVRLWRQARQNQQLPAAETIATSRTHTGFHNVRLLAKNRSVKLLKPQMQLDLGGIAKGYAADQAFKVLQQAGFSRSLVAASGDIRVGDAPPDRNAWHIALDPYSKGSTETIELINQAVSTSGSAEQSFEAGGIRYSHILDPRSGLGLTTPIAVSVIASQGIFADAWATAFSVLGPVGSVKIQRKLRGINVIFFDARVPLSKSTR